MRSTPESSRDDEILTFGVFELDAAAMVLRRAGARLKLRAQPMQLLLLLARSEGAVVTREEIRARLWGADVHVDFSRGINACIKAIRATLRDDAQAPRFIETMPGIGYRFIAPVEHRARPTAASGEPASGEPASGEPASGEPASGEPTADEPVASEPATDEPAADAPPQLRAGDSRGSPALVDTADASAIRRSDGEPRQSWPWLRAVVSASVGVGVCVGLVVLVSSPLAVPSATSTASTMPSPSPSVVADRDGPIRLAVVPFVELGPVPDGAALGDALTWELIAELSHRHPERLEVIAIESMLRSRDRPHEPAELHRMLGVDHVLRGTIVHGEQRIRLTFTLVRTSDGAVAWSDTRELELADLAALQAKVGDEIAHALALELLPRRPEPPMSAVPPEAYQAYLRGRAALTRPEPDPVACTRAASELDAALALAPGLAVAHAARARAYQQCPGVSHEVVPRARDAARRALELDPHNVEAHVILGRIAFYYDLDPEASRQWLERALELDPGHAEAHHALATYYTVRGRHDASMRSLERARRLDPLSPLINMDFGWLAYFGRRYHEAIGNCRAALEHDPDGAIVHMCIVQAARALGDHRLAAEHARAYMASAASASPAELDAVLREQPTETLREIWRWFLRRSQAPGSSASHSWMAVLHVMLGHHDEAIAELQRAHALRQGWLLPFLAVDPVMDPLREDHRFRALLAQIEASRGPLRAPPKGSSSVREPSLASAPAP